VQAVEVLKKGVVEELDRRLFQFHILVGSLAGTAEVNVYALRHHLSRWTTVYSTLDERKPTLSGLASFFCKGE
jgi:hypothetical protein